MLKEHFSKIVLSFSLLASCEHLFAELGQDERSVEQTGETLKKNTHEVGLGKYLYGYTDNLTFYTRPLLDSVSGLSGGLAYQIKLPAECGLLQALTFVLSTGKTIQRCQSQAPSL